MVFEENFSVKGKEEHILVLVDTDGLRPITYTNIGTLARVFMFITPLTTVLVDPIVTLTLTIDNTVDPVFDIELPTRKILYWMPDPTFAPYITAIQVSTTSTTEVQVEFRAYGE